MNEFVYIFFKYEKYANLPYNCSTGIGRIVAGRCNNSIFKLERLAKCKRQHDNKTKHSRNEWTINVISFSAAPRVDGRGPGAFLYV